MYQSFISIPQRYRSRWTLTISLGLIHCDRASLGYKVNSFLQIPIFNVENLTLPGTPAEYGTCTIV
ncbi:uncharacterized protein ARMOST_22166 [Armillaria ostoyae]|uniref:Uncharacterized protein n=1 Tax=Armillaria ostoyae TaxID=47428 RepID=A0A284SC43_ARMOS|nr:uncharacterized protein ARMOST_22166 [Armillaria ostoyae]